MKKAFIFDMDGLLIDSEPLWQRTGIEVLNHYGIPVTLADMHQWTGLPVPIVVSRAAAQFQLDIDQAEVSAAYLEDAMQRIVREKPLMPAVKETLALLAEHNITMAIASASPRAMLESIVEGCGIAHYFCYISSAHELAYSKPHPVVYLNACQQLGLNPVDCVGLEDSKVGMIAVKAASMSCIVVPAANAFEQPHWVLAERKLRTLADIDSTLLESL